MRAEVPQPAPDIPCMYICCVVRVYIYASMQINVLIMVLFSGNELIFMLEGQNKFREGDIVHK